MPTSSTTVKKKMQTLLHRSASVYGVQELVVINGQSVHHDPWNYAYTYDLANY
jgi:hypothetical protein